MGMLAHRDVERLRIARPEDDQLRAVNLSSWDGKPPPERDWLVERCFTRGSVGLVSGDGGIGKSIILQQLLSAAVVGRPWFGQATQAGRAMFFGCEDDEKEMVRRQHAICRHMGYSMTDLEEAGLVLVPRVGHENTLSRLDRKEWRMVVTDLFQRILAKCLEEGITYVVIDTATQTFAGNQNDEQQVVQFCNQLRRLAVAIQGCVIITKHPSVAGRALGTGESGSVSWSNSVRSRMYLHRDKSGLNLSMKKSNYGPADLNIPVKWERGTFVLDEPEQPKYNGRYDD
jgi:RecA-family ATPase